MRARTPIILFIILVLLVGGIYFLSRYQQKKKAEENLLVKLEHEVRRVELIRQDGADLVFKKEAGRWMMEKPKKVPADGYILGRIADEVKELRYRRLVEEKATDLKKYGLDDPKAIVKVWERGKPNPVVIKIGDKNPMNSNRYAKLEGDSRVVILSSLFTDLALKAPSDYRDKKIARFDESLAEKIQVQGKYSYTLVKKGDDWWMSEPVKSMADNYKCEDLLYTLTGTDAKFFVKDSAEEKDIKEYGLDKPDLTIKVFLKGKKQPLELKLKKKDDKVYLLKGNMIVEVEDSLLDTFSKEPKEFREKKLVKFYSFDVKGFTWKRGKEVFQAKKKGKEWEALKPFKAPLDDEKVEGFLRNIEDLQAEDFIDNPAGFKPEVVVDFKLEKKTQRVEFGEMDGKLVGRTAGLGYLLKFDRKLSDIFPQDLKAWKRKEKEDKKK